MIFFVQKIHLSQQRDVRSLSKQNKSICPSDVRSLGTRNSSYEINCLEVRRRRQLCRSGNISAQNGDCDFDCWVPESAGPDEDVVELLKVGLRIQMAPAAWFVSKPRKKPQHCSSCQLVIDSLSMRCVLWELSSMTVRFC